MGRNICTGIAYEYSILKKSLEDSFGVIDDSIREQIRGQIPPCYKMFEDEEYMDFRLSSSFTGEDIASLIADFRDLRPLQNQDDSEMDSWICRDMQKASLDEAFCMAEEEGFRFMDTFCFPDNQDNSVAFTIKGKRVRLDTLVTGILIDRDTECTESTNEIFESFTSLLRKSLENHPLAGSLLIFLSADTCC